MPMKVKSKTISSLISLILLMGIVYAVSLDENYSFLRDKDEALIEFNPGWNLLTTQVHENVKAFFPEVGNEDICKLNEFKATYVYDSITKKYISEKDLYEGYFSPEGDDRFKSSMGSAWFYSEKNCVLMLDSDIVEDTGNLGLIQGWNFLSITPSMIDKSFNDFKGTCQIISVYGWDSQSQKWGVFGTEGLSSNIEAMIGLGFIIKVQDSCKLNFGSSSPEGGFPPLPD